MSVRRAAPGPAARGLTAESDDGDKELELEGDLNITAVWGTGDTSEKPVGFTDVRVKVNLEADTSDEEIAALIDHVKAWSPVANTFTRPVNLDIDAG